MVYFPDDVWNIIKSYSIDFNPQIRTIKCGYRQCYHISNEDEDDDFIDDEEGIHIILKNYYYITRCWVFEIQRSILINDHDVNFESETDSDGESEDEEYNGYMINFNEYNMWSGIRRRIYSHDETTYSFYYLNNERRIELENSIYHSCQLETIFCDTKLNDLNKLIPNHYIKPIKDSIIRKLLSKTIVPNYITVSDTNWFKNCQITLDDAVDFDYEPKEFDEDTDTDFIENYQAYDIRNESFEYTDFQPINNDDEIYN